MRARALRKPRVDRAVAAFERGLDLRLADVETTAHLPAALGQRLHRAPEVIVIEFLSRRSLEAVHLAALRVQPRHHVLDGAVLSRRIHRLKDDQQRVPVLCVENVLELRKLPHAL